MNTQELRQNIEKVLGNNIRCLLPSYWWKKLFNQVVDTVEDNALPIVKSEEDLKNLEVPEGSIASVVASIVWKSFASFKLPSASNATSLLSYPHIPKINVTNAPITVIPQIIIGLTDMQHTSQQTGKFLILGIEDDSVVGYGYSIVGGNISELIGPYIFRSAYSTTVNTTAVNAINSILSTSVFRFVGFDLFSGNSDNSQADINQLCSIFTWGDTSNGVYVKDENWQRLALTTELPDISGITNIQVDDTMSSTSTNPVQNKVIKSYVDTETVTVGSTCQLYSNSGNITLRKGKGYIRNSSGQYIAAGDVVIKSLEYDDSFRDRILVFGGATSLTIPSNVLWENGITPVIDPEVIYVLNIKTGIVKDTTISVATLNVYSDNPINSDSISKEIQDYVDSNCYDSRILYVGFANSLSEEQLAYNIETYNKLIAHDKVLVYISGLSTSPLFPLTLISFNSIDKTIKFAHPSNNDDSEVTFTLSSDGSVTESVFSKLVGYDTYLSTTSDNAVQNKVITEALNNKVDKIQGKGLSSEDFTTELKQKLESISLIEADGLIDTSNLATKNELAQKQDVISDIDTIRSNAANYKGTVTSVKIDNVSKSQSSGVVDLGYINKQLTTSTSSSMTLSPNIYYRNTSTSLSTLTITLGSVSNSNIINEYFVEFTTSSSGTTVSLPITIKWVNGETPTFEASTTYQISIVNNLGVVTKFK